MTENDSPSFASELDEEDRESFNALIKDLSLLADVDPSLFERLGSLINDPQVMLTEKLLRKHCSDVFNDEAITDSVVRLLTSLNVNSFGEFTEWFSSIMGADTEKYEMFAKACGNLIPLFKNEQPILVLQKSMALVRYTGNELKRLHFVCDNRPLFNGDHTRIVGYLPLTHFLIGYEEQTGASHVFEIVLTEHDLDLLIKAAADAKQKLGLIHSSNASA